MSKREESNNIRKGIKGQLESVQLCAKEYYSFAEHREEGRKEILIEATV